jgi:hypothetical protein
MSTMGICVYSHMVIKKICTQELWEDQILSGKIRHENYHFS